MNIDDLIYDDKNFNIGTTLGSALIEKSISKYGAARSILIDKNGKIIAGNKTVENAKKAGINKVLVVEVEGDKLVAVKRTDIKLDSKAGRELALADNVTAKQNILFDLDLILSESADLSFDALSWGIDIGNHSVEIDLPEKDNSKEVSNKECTCPQCQHIFKP